MFTSLVPAVMGKAVHESASQSLEPEAASLSLRASILFQILCISEEKKGDETVCQQWNAKFQTEWSDHLQRWSQIFWSEETETDLST